MAMQLVCLPGGGYLQGAKAIQITAQMKQIVIQKIILKLGTSKWRGAWLMLTLEWGSCLLAGGQGNTDFSSDETVIDTEDYHDVSK